MLRPITNAGIAGNGPFIVCGGTSSGNGVWEAPSGPARNILNNARTDVDYASWAGHNFAVHWSQMASNQAPNTDCGAGSQMNGLADTSSTCTPNSSSATVPRRICYSSASPRPTSSATSTARIRRR